ncbi:MAG TPA: ABC transporter permease [Candidatus Choladousia intestinavium]|uniref:ABC transporter permease n=1 Tax=Candidatus Choladousia intestinavium TaxID=2840727 RepID=A0A9D1ACG6_9FIRM|nr:ABC transporter permease [Candidatus Choladousia intestinavium]
MGKKIDTSKYEDHVILGPVIRYLKSNLGILLAFLILCIVLSIAADNFLTVNNWLTILRTVSTTGYLAIGVMLAIMLGGIDLVGGAMIACTGCLTVVCMERWGLPMVVAIIIGLAVGIVAGFINGWIIAYSGIHPFVVTLAMQSILRGAAYLIADGQPVPLYVNDVYPTIGTGLLGGLVPYPVIYMLIFFFLQYLLLNKTKMGRYIYAVGGNATAAQFSGIDIKKVKIMVWTISGFLSAFAGIVLSARLSSGQPSTSVGAETDAIAACVLGGTSMYGGVGCTGGVLIGVLVIGVITNGLTLLHVNSNWQYVAKGVIILLAVYIDMIRQNKMQSRSE